MSRVRFKNHPHHHHPD
ncbi:his operon leader peptide [Enterobacter intestinihominis]